MRETSFIEQNREKWAEFERILQQPNKDPEKLNELYIQITDDLSYARTFYPNRSVRVYLNSLAQRVFFQIYRTPRSIIGRLGRFWLDELPRLMYEARRDFALSFFVFALAFGLGMLSSAMEPEFLRSILGDAYVDQTLDNIEQGDPMAIYKDRDRLGMSMGITLNNLYVALLTFVMGILAGIGSIGIMLYNGIMIGAFQYFFLDRGLFWDSFLTVWIHGTLEISAIIIAGAAGITMGRGIAFPGTYSRLQSFQQSARRGLKILIGIVPIIILAGFIEGYLTRYTETPDLIRGLFIAACLAFVLIYFVWYPSFRAKMGFDPQDQLPELPADRDQSLRFSTIKSNGDLFGDVFLLFRKKGWRLVSLSFLVALVYTLVAFATANGPLERIFFFPDEALGKFQVIDDFFFNNRNWRITPALFILLCLYTTAVFGIIRQEKGLPLSTSQWWLRAVMMLFPIGISLLILYTRDWYTIFLVAFLLPFPLLYMAAGQLYSGLVHSDDRLTLSRIGNLTRHLMQGIFSRALGLLLMMLMVGFLFYALLDTILLFFYLDMVSLVIYLEGQSMTIFMIILETLLSIWMILMVIGLILWAFGLLAFSNAEIRNATDLQRKIREIALPERIKGLEKEDHRL